MEIILSNRAEKVKPSPTLAIDARAKKLKAEGGDIISLSVGEPDFDTPAAIKQAAIKAINDGFTKYTAVDGIPELKQAIVNKFKNENALNYAPDQIIVSNGAKQSFYNLAQAYLNPGDEVIIPAPYWASYPDMAMLADAIPVFIPAPITQNFKITAQQLEEAITPRTRLLVLNSPGNPSGMVYSRNELAALGEVLLRHPNILIVSDDMYEHIIWTHEPYANIVNACPELNDRTVVINGVSKAYAMTGWRIGYAGGPKKIIATMSKIQSQSTSNPNSIAQKAACAALDGNQQCVLDMVKEFKIRHEFLLQFLKGIPGIKCLPSQGTFYSFPDISGILTKMPNCRTDLEFAEQLLVKGGVAVVPGSAFGDANCIRLSFATSMEKLNDALQRMKMIIEGKAV